MATIENLNFKVILKDDDFKNKIAALQELANDFNVSMTTALSLAGAKGGAQSVKDIEKALREATAAQKDFNAAVKASPAEKVTIRHHDAVTATNAKLFYTARMLRTIGTLTGGAFSVYGLRRFLSTLVEVTGQFEVQKMALRTMLQDIDAADKIFQDLYRFSSDSTYRFSELAKYSKQLAAFNIGKESLLETTKMLGDVASGVGVSMDRLILAYGHVKSSGFLRGIQLRSFSQNGVPILDELAKMFTEIEGKAVSLGEVFDKMTKREIPFEMVEEAFKRMTSEGGKFYQMQEVLSKTLAGQMNILKGRWENLMYAIGQSQEGMLKGAVSSISNLIADYDRFGEAIKRVVISFGIYKVTQLGIIATTDAAAFANLRLVKTFRSLSAAIATNPWTLLAVAVAAATYAIIKAETALSDTEKIQASATKSIRDFNSAVNAEIGELDALYAKLKLAGEGTEEYGATKKAIESRFGTYIEQLRQEGVAVDDLSLVYDNLADKIRDANKERFLESSMADLGKTWGDVQKDIDKEFEKITKGIEKDLGRALTQMERQSLERSVKGNIAEGTEEVVANTIAGIYDALQGGAKGTRNTGMYGRAQFASQKDIPNYETQLQSLTSRYSAGMKQYADSVTELHDAFDTLNKSISTNNKEEDEQVYRLSSIIQGIKNLDAEIDKLRSKVRNGSITQTEKERLDALVEDREGQAKLYKSIMGVDYDKPVKAGNNAAEQARKREISDLKAQAAVLTKYREAYETLRPLIGEANMPSALESLFGKKFENTDFETELDRIILKLAALGEEGQQAAESLRASLGKGELAEIKKAIAAQDKATEMLAAYLEKDFGIEGEGVAAQISKILVDLTNKNLKADKNLEKFIEELDKAELAKKLEYIAENFEGPTDAEGQKVRDRYATEYWKKWREEQIKAYKERLKQEKAANKKLSDEQIVGKADDIFKSLTGGIDLTNWNDKTISQLQTIRAELLSLSIPEDILALLDEETQKRLIEAFNARRGGEVKKADNVISERNVKAAQRLLAAFNGIGSAITEMGDAMDNNVLSGVGNILSLAEEITGVITENDSLMKSILGTTEKVSDESENLEEGLSDLSKSTDWITMIIKLVLIYFRELAGVIGENEERMRAFSDAAIAAREAMYDASLHEGVDSIFGTNFNRSLQNAVRNIQDITSAIKEYGDEISSKQFTSSRMSWFAWLISGNYGNREPRERKTTLEQLAAGINRDLYDSYNNLNAETLEAILETYKDLTDEERYWIERAIADSKAYAEAIGEVEDVMESVFGEIASSAADNIVDSWIEAGSAALDYADILDDVAKSYAKMLIQSAILDDVLNDDEAKRVMSMFASGDREGAMAAIAGDMEKIAAMEPIFADILQSFEPYFNREGSDNTLANGLKGMTEDTASLIASYLNAIRADVSMLRALAQQGWGSVENISTSLAVLPTLNDYVARIDAHNANIDASTRQILVELQGVIVNEGSGRGFRSYPA